MVAAIKITFDAKGPLSALADAQAAGRDLRPALRAIARAGVNQTKKRFIAQRAPDGSPWKPSNNKNGTTLRLSGLLFGSISDRPPEAAAVEWGSNRVYAGVHQDGFSGQVQVRAHERQIRSAFGRQLRSPVRFTVAGHARKMNTPARPYLGVNAENLAEFANIGLGHLAAPLGGA